MRFRTVIFDLDGTLVDSLVGIEASARHAVTQCLPERVLPEMRELIGPPIARMFARLWPDLLPAQLDAVVEAFREHYDREGCLRSKLFPGVRETLASLARDGVAMFVLTNKPARAAQRILLHLNILFCFTEVVSPDTRQPPFPVKAEGAKHLQARHGLEPASTLLVGDGPDDLEAAEVCGFGFVAAAYGYGGVAARPGQPGLPTAKIFSEVGRFVL